MTKPLRNLLLIVLTLLVVGAVSYVLFAKKALSPSEPAPGGSAATEQRYVSAEHGFSFAYPKSHTVVERAEPDHDAIVIVRQEDLVPPEGGEYPPTVTIGVYPATGSVTDWIERDSRSNFQLGNKQLAKTTVDGQEAYSYTWSGLYEGKTTVLRHKDAVVAVSTTWMTPEDETLKTYDAVLASFDLN